MLVYCYCYYVTREVVYSLYTKHNLNFIHALYLQPATSSI